MSDKEIVEEEEIINILGTMSIFNDKQWALFEYLDEKFSLIAEIYNQDISENTMVHHMKRLILKIKNIGF